MSAWAAMVARVTGSVVHAMKNATVSIRSKPAATDSLGHPTGTGTLIAADLAAVVMPSGAGEAEEGEMVVHRNRRRILIDYRDDVEPGFTLELDGQVHAIEAIESPGAAQSALLLTVTANGSTQ